MTTVSDQADNTTDPSIEEAGEKVSGGSEAAQEKSGGADNTNAEKKGEELMPEKETKKEEIDGYNEHPDQAKVGGG